ncbi:NADAR domain-containing protein [Aphelenchoides besseyi]|nr:NADAR domain-containing protein [Aphelenchoides besseyi]KAI6194996.1 NADAR domain-containing protein [Aphelenchoides besseyi]
MFSIHIMNENGRTTPRNLCEISDRAMNDIFCSIIRNPPDESCRHFYLDARASSSFLFSGNHSPFTPTSPCSRPLIIDGQSYRTVEDYVRFKKFMELTGSPPNTNGSQRSSLRIVAGAKTIEQWIINRGLIYLQNGILHKLKSDVGFYEKLMATNDKMICYTYAKDQFYAAGCSMNDFLDWFQRCGNSNFYFKFPVRLPLRCADLACLPNIMDGYNVLGAIYMSIRETLRYQSLETANIDVSILGDITPKFPAQVGRPLAQSSYRQPLRDCDSRRSIDSHISAASTFKGADRTRAPVDPRKPQQRALQRERSPHQSQPDSLPSEHRHHSKDRENMPTQGHKSSPPSRSFDDDEDNNQLPADASRSSTTPVIDTRDPASIPWTPRSPDPSPTRPIKTEVLDIPSSPLSASRRSNFEISHIPSRTQTDVTTTSASTSNSEIQLAKNYSSQPTSLVTPLLDSALDSKNWPSALHEVEMNVAARNCLLAEQSNTATPDSMADTRLQEAVMMFRTEGLPMTQGSPSSSDVREIRVIKQENDSI